MASYTEKLNLLKKDPTADASDTFNIRTMLNDNWDKLDANAADVTAEMAGKVPLSAINASGVDCNDLLADGRYQIFSAEALNTPPWATPEYGHFHFSVHRFDDLWVRQIAIEANGRRIWERAKLDGTWSNWEQIATATPPEACDIPLGYGWSSIGNTTFRKAQDRLVTINIKIGMGGAAIGAGGYTVGTMPAGYRPASGDEPSAVGTDAADATYQGLTVRLWVTADGGIGARIPTTIPAKSDAGICGTITYYAGN